MEEFDDDGKCGDTVQVFIANRKGVRICATASVRDGLHLFEDEIVVETGCGYGSPWPNRTLPFKIEANMTQRKRDTIEKGIDVLRVSLGDCVRFRAARRQEHHVLFKSHPKRSYSHVGYQGCMEQVLCTL